MKNNQNTKTVIVFGKVTQFDAGRNFGIAVISGTPPHGMRTSYSLSKNNGPYVVRINERLEPELAAITNQYPPVGAEIALDFMASPDGFKLKGWCCAIAYRRAEKLANKMARFAPELAAWAKGHFRYRLTKQAFSNGQPLSEAEEIAYGSRDELSLLFPVGDKDPLTKFTKSNTKKRETHLHWWMLEPKAWHSGMMEWVEVADPRIARTLAMTEMIPTLVIPRKPSSASVQQSAQRHIGHGFRAEIKDFSALDGLVSVN